MKKTIVFIMVIGWLISTVPLTISEEPVEVEKETLFKD